MAGRAVRLAAVLFLAGGARGQGLPLRGRAVDAAGAPVAAQVAVGCQSATPFRPFELLASTRADASGRFALELPAEWVARGAVYRELDLVAWAEGHGLEARHFALEELPAGSELELRLPPDPGTRLRLVDEDGAPIVGARVWPERVEPPGAAFLRVPDEWWARRAPRTDADGAVRLPVAREALLALAVDAGEGGTWRLHRHPNARDPLPEELVLGRTRELALSIPAGIPPRSELEATSYAAREPEAGARYSVNHEWRGRVGAGQRTFVLLGPGRAVARLETADTSALALGGLVEEEGELRFGPAVGFPVRARFVDAETGAPLAGVRLRVRGLHTGHVASDADGRVAFDCAWPFSVDELLAPEGHASERFTELRGAAPQGADVLDLGERRVARTWTARGRVLDERGEPAAGAWVLGAQQVAAGRMRLDVALSALTDARGEYALAGAYAGHALEVSARLGDLRAQGAQAEGEALELDLESSLRARGRVLDERGAPIAGVEVELWRAPPEGFVNGHARAELGGARRFRTDAEGRFETPGGLEAAARYCVLLDDPRHEGGESAWLTAAELSAGIELHARPLGVARGVLRGADGRPLAGAELRARRSDLRCTTDAAGRFELPGVSAGGELLVALDADGAPHVRRVDAGDELDWTLLPHGAERPLAPAPAHERGRELELALELLEARYQEALASGDEGRLLRALRGFARVDPARALERVERGLFETPWMRDFALAYVADALESSSPEEALAVAARIERGMSRELAVLDAAERLEPAAEREQLALVRAAARAVDPPEHRAIVYRQLADRLLDLGEREAALEVIAEGRAVAESLPAEEWPGYARGRFGELLARVDLEAGQALIAPLSEDPERHLFNLAHELAASDPAAAEALLEPLARRPGFWSAASYAARIAHRMAPVDLERARRVAGHDPSGFADGMIALALAPESNGAGNRAEALVSLDAGFRKAERRSETLRSAADRPVAAVGALLPVAERVDPENLRAWVERALALRPRAAPRAFEFGAWQHWGEEAALAYYVARWDRAAARALLAPVLERARRPSEGDFDSSYDAAFAAAAAIDPEEAARLARELGGRAMDVVGVVLALDPAERARYVQDELLRLWVVGKEDL